MIKTLQTTLQKIGSRGMVAAFFALVAVLSLGISSVASAQSNRYPDYFGVDKPGSTSVCEGGSWEGRRGWNKNWEWKWGDDWGWWHHGPRWVPNWKKLGFDSYGQCIRFVSTAKPQSRQECRARWWQLGFGSRGECRRYLRLFPPGGGYGGNPQDPNPQQRGNGNQNNNSQDEQSDESDQ